MPESISSSLVAEKNKRYTDAAWVWLIQIQVSDTQAMRLTTFDAELTYDGEIYSPGAIEVNDVTRDAGGVLPTMEVHISNASRDLEQFITDDDVLDRECIVRAVNTNEDPIVSATNEVTFTVIGLSVSLEVIRLQLGKPNLFDPNFPSQRYSRTKCVNTYGDAACGFIRTRSYANTPSTYPNANAATCDYGEQTPNGCEAHGELERVNGYTVKHPRLWKAWKNIPKGPARV